MVVHCVRSILPWKYVLDNIAGNSLSLLSCNSVGEIYDPSQNFLLKKVTHRLDTDVLFKEAFMRAVKIYMTVENMLEAMHRFDSKEQMIILQRANLKVSISIWFRFLFYFFLLGTFPWFEF